MRVEVKSTEEGIIADALECLKRHTKLYAKDKLDALIAQYNRRHQRIMQGRALLNQQRRVGKKVRFFIADGVTYEDVKHLEQGTR